MEVSLQSAAIAPCDAANAVAPTTAHAREGIFMTFLPFKVVVDAAKCERAHSIRACSSVPTQVRCHALVLYFSGYKPRGAAAVVNEAARWLRRGARASCARCRRDRTG